MGWRIAFPSSPGADAPSGRLTRPRRRTGCTVVDRVSTAQVAVGSADESGPRSDVLMKGDPNRLIDKDAELGQEPVQWRGIPSDREDKGPMDVHALLQARDRS